MTDACLIVTITVSLFAIATCVDVSPSVYWPQVVVVEHTPQGGAVCLAVALLRAGSSLTPNTGVCYGPFVDSLFEQATSRATVLPYTYVEIKKLQQ